jgi:hypothetical protein
MDWARILAFVTGMVDQELLTRIEYLAAENRILKAQSSITPRRGASSVREVMSQTPSMNTKSRLELRIGPLSLPKTPSIDSRLAANQNMIAA